MSNWTRDLQKMMDGQQQIEQDNLDLNRLKNKLYSNLSNTGYKSFYFWSSLHELRYKRSGGNCCLYHILGAAQKHGKDMPLLPWQRLFWDLLHEYRKIWVKKSRGIGFSTLMLYIIAYKCLTEFKPGDRIVIITGIRIETAADLIRRYKLLFQKNFPGIFVELSKQKDTLAILNGVIVECYPAGHTDSIRGLDRVKMCWVDEGDMFSPGESRNIRSCVEGFLPKPNSENMYLVLSSTPAKPLGLFETIEKESPSIYYKLFLPYQYGLEGPNPIYDLEYIQEMKDKSPEWPREFELQYVGKVGNVFSPQSIENCQRIEYNSDVVIPNARVSMGIDPSFGSSKFGIVAVRFVDSRIQVVIAEEHDRPDFNSMIDRIYEIKKKMGIDVCYVDAANPVIWQPLKKNIFHENHAESYVFSKLTECEKNNTDPHTFMNVVPVAFSKYHKSMLQNTKSLVEDPDNLVLIDKRFDKLLIALRTAVAKEYELEKKETSYNDVLDAFRLSLQAFKRNK
jgi:hypothetical protein